ncbi:integrin beta chain [Gregarina niphandrodes]|uniref:Integrin beta chain n=1 Tax=Gregarina niphandrodes TaxID=110365 RepID=A0A023B853_GRENI|nr:integrin beta chain [Gregarina niphandrodes]EZG68158.1 integrin beta chain [Gregarina niphandrodes]|eukprot:XP_011130052.1 integrin beta chain [Gregarina niphandrodes]
MFTLRLLALIGGIFGEEISQRGGETGLGLPQVLPDLKPVDDAQRWADRTKTSTLTKDAKPRVVYGERYFQTRQPEVCNFPMEIVILQDLTDSFSDNIVQMKNVQLHQMIDGLAQSHPGSKFSMVSFQDKAIYPLGNRDDACWTFYSDFSTDTQPVYDAYAQAVSYGGADAPENHFGAILAAMESSNISWSPLGSEYTRLIVVVTDAAPHHADDGLNPDPATLKPWQGEYSDAQAADLCLKTYYPSAQQMYDQIVARQTYIAALVFDADWEKGWAATGWKTFNRFLAQPEGMVEPDAEDSSGFWTQLSKIIDVMEAVECSTDTTTPAPASTTTAPPPAPTTTTPPPAPTTTTPPPAPTTTTPPPVPTTTPAECPPAIEVTDGDCIPTPENCYCQPDVLIQLMEKPDRFNLVGDDQTIVNF